MINATKHARERYAERIKGIEKDAIKSNVAMYGNDYEKDLNKMYDNSRLIYTGRFQTHKECQYRLADDIILVMDKIDQNLITLYRVDFNFTKSINKVILQDLVEELDVKEKAWSLEKEKTEEANSELNNEKALLEMDIEAKAKELENKWTRWAEQQHVYPFEYRPWTERINYYQSLYPDQKGKEN